ncbi:MAG TPA: CpsD/CapB family tyrosine-protein kinase [Vicinamibacterales bacterium]|jgi:capsular exopolysaccharide synthesis family protein
MSRVEEALRRAGTASAPERQADLSADVRGFEQFPHERADGPRAPRHEPAVAVARNTPPATILSPRSLAPEAFGGISQDVEGKIVIDGEVAETSIEQYNRLATSLHLIQTHTGLRTLMISSALPRDGKTLTAANLALTLSESYKRHVLLIDADLRRPSVHEVFRVPNASGLADCLRGDGAISVPFIQVSPYLTILPSGPTDETPMAGLASARLQALLKNVKTRFDWVIVDTPPVGIISDASILASQLDGVLLVIGAGATPYEAVKRAVTEFGKDRIVGVVLNRVSAQTIHDKSYAQHYGRRQAGGDVR